ncbi:hypothetical protein AVEN_133696-1 [Araneus ventricosus]|uniref:Uncharacterized protein n=1 Tax=Araneus ventricosus TaxID=182803 RepID=A0A4Y2B9E3_ARAVE|nr:hypothetical protein AVEN_133696-1 [Araneus ventricosus]
MTKTSPELASSTSLSPNFRATPVGGHLILEVKFGTKDTQTTLHQYDISLQNGYVTGRDSFNVNIHQAHIHVGSSVESWLRTWNSQIRNTIPPIVAT